MIGIIIFIVIYLLSAWKSYKWIQIALYHPKGEYYKMEKSSSLILLVIAPFVNTAFAVFTLFESQWDSKYIKQTNFFKPKKPFKE
jgi:hypothetical protein